MKSMVRLTIAALNDAATITGISTSRDVKTLQDRCNKEGYSFLTMTLPSFEKDLLSSIENGQILPTYFSGFAKVGRVPRFLGGLMEALFAPNGDYRVPIVAEDWGYHALVLQALRQVLLINKKVDLDCTEARRIAAINQYKVTDREIREVSASDIRRFSSMSTRLFGRFFDEVAHDLFIKEDHKFTHAGGALATRETFNQRFASNTWTERLQAVFPYWGIAQTGYKDGQFAPFTVLPLAEETPSRVTTVPKTLKAPRIIAMEPVWNMFVQQGIFRTMSSVLYSDPRFRLLRDGFGWKDQTQNQTLARVGSTDKSLVTVDLSEASDRVSAQLVHDGLFGRYGTLRQAIFACRSERADVEGDVISLKKFASMGNALTFPVESMVFYTIVHLAWERTYGLSPKRALSFKDGVRVYGDDIICPRAIMPALKQELETYGLKINIAKSFSKGFFRESCGADYFAGYDVNVVKASRVLPNQRHLSSSIEKSIRFHNHLVKTGWSGTAKHVAEHLNSLRYVPYGPPIETGLHLHTDDESAWRVRFDNDLHGPAYYTLRVRLAKPVDRLGDYGALRKFFFSRSVDREEDHLVRDGRSQYVGLHTGWVTVT